MLKKIFLFTNLLVFIYIGYSQNDTNLISRATDLIKERDFFEANTILAKIIEKDSLNIDIIKKYAYTFLKLNKNQNAEEYFNKALTIDENCSFCYAALAKIFYEYDIIQAENYLANAEKFDNTESYIYYVKALIKRGSKEYENAITEFGRALYFYPKNIDYLYERANTYLIIQKNQDAIKDFNSILEIDANNPTILYYLAYTYLLNSDLNNALKSINEAIKIDSLVADYYNLKFSILYNKKDIYNAEDALLKSMEVNPNDFNVYINLGDIYFQTGKYDAFCTSYNYALKIMSDVEKKQYPEISEKTKKYCDENSLGYYFMRSQADFLSQNYDKALEYVNNALKINNKNSLLHNQKSSVLLAKKKYAEAELETDSSILYQNTLDKEIKEFYAIELSPEQIISVKNSYMAKYQLQKAILQTIKKEYDNSLSSINIALDIASREKSFPGIEYIHLAAAINYLALSNNNLAIKSINLAQEINPLNPITTLYSAYYLLLSACNYNQDKVEYDYIEDIKLARIIFPELTLKKELKTNLQEAILLCNKLIEKYPNNPYLYLIKSKASELLSIPDYCSIAKIGEEKGLINIFEELKIKCE